MKKDIDVQFLCKNCERYNLCRYYHNRKEDSYICKYFHLPNKLDKIRAEIEPTRKMYLEMNDIDWLNGCDYVLSVIDKHKAEK